MPPERISKVLAAAGVTSRRGADELIAAGRVTIDGRPAELGERVDPAEHELAIDGRPIGGRTARPIHLVMHKPPGVTSTVRDRHATRTIVDLVPDDLGRGARLYPVGRLDRDSEGLILLTDDGAWADAVLHPRHGVEREYAIAVSRPLRAEQVQRLARGIELEEGTARLHGLREQTVTETRRLTELLAAPVDPNVTWYRATLDHGWKRQLRRMFGAVGAPVRRLARVRIGPLWLEGLSSGQVRSLTTTEVRRLGTAASRSVQPRLVVALDGPASSGKSSVGAAAAERLGYRFLDTGLLYRALTYLALTLGHRPSDVEPLVADLARIELVPEGAGGRSLRVQLDGSDVTDEVHSPRVDRHVSAFAAIPEVRRALVPRQRDLAAAGGIVMAGRDIGTTILPDADLKLYLDASAEERARRRTEERGLDPDGEEAAAILEDLRRRDTADSGRALAPLRPADDALTLRTDGNTREQTIALVVEAIRDAEARARAEREAPATR